MAWREVKMEEQRLLFIEEFQKQNLNISELCREFNISRPTAYKWIKRFNLNGIEGVKELSRKPLRSPFKTCVSIENKILELKYAWGKWGPKKIHGHLQRCHPEIDWPSVTTVENILKRFGLVIQRKLRKRLAKQTDPLGDSNQSNDTWCFDFKGWWKTKDQKQCSPFTVTDAFSRYLLCCEQLDLNNTKYVWAVFEKLFREYGLPLRVRSDNGPPFATLGAGRLSKLSINLIKAGVVPEWIDPGEPQQNGRHERMHLTLKQEAVNEQLSLEEQVKKLHEFKEYYNFIRPHEALKQKTPGEMYEISERYWNGKLNSPEYGNEYSHVIKVKECGKASYKGREIYVGRVFAKEPIGLKEAEKGLTAYYGSIYLGIIKEKNLEFERRQGRCRLSSSK